jgi:hypothetical protein
MNAFAKRYAILGLFSMLLFAAGCATTDNKAAWNSRIGNYTFDGAVLDYGPPDKVASLTDGTKIAEWLLQRGRNYGSMSGGPGHWMSYNEVQTPDYFLRLTFTPQGQLKEWKKLAR